MKRLLLLPILLGAELTAFADPSPSEVVREKLPAYSPEEHARIVAEEEAREKARAAARAAAEADPDLVVLPDMTVLEKTERRMAEESLYRKGAYDKELVKRELSAFDRYFLNRFTIPFLGVSKEARARQAYLDRKNAELQDRMARLNRLVSRLDSAEAREFREVLRDANLDNSNSTKEAARATSARGGSGGKNGQ